MSTVAHPLSLFFRLDSLCSHTVHTFFSPSDDYIAIGADCEELGAQIEEYILHNDVINFFQNAVFSIHPSHFPSRLNPQSARGAVCFELLK